MKERIHTLAEEAGLYCDGTPDAWDQEAIEKFAALVAAAEREACVRICEQLSNVYADFKNPEYYVLNYCATAIRAREKK